MYYCFYFPDLLTGLPLYFSEVTVNISLNCIFYALVIYITLSLPFLIYFLYFFLVVLFWV